MYSLRLHCSVAESELVSTELWDAGTTAVAEFDAGERVVLVAGFETNRHRETLLKNFRAYSPEWRHEPERDWVAESKAAWSARAIGQRFFLAPVWSEEQTPSGRQRIVHTPGMACGTGEHPCTQLAMMALEKCVAPGSRVVDVGTGSGVLAIAALRLGAAVAVGVDPDEAALAAAKENFTLNGLAANLAVASANCLAAACADVTVANISGTVLLAIFDDLLRLTRPAGWMILTGFPVAEASAFEGAFHNAETFRMDEWRCIVARPLDTLGLKSENFMGYTNDAQ